MRAAPMSTTTRTRLRRAVTAALVAVAVSGCGGAATTGERTDTLAPQAALAAAVSQAEQVRSSRFSLSTTTEIGGQRTELGGEGVFDYAAQSGEMTFTLPRGGGDLRQRVVDDVMYLQLPQEPDVFYELRLSDLADTSLAASTDPTGGLQALRGAGDDVAEIGSEDIRGAATTHYRGTLDVNKSLEALKGPMRDALEQALSTSDLREVPFDAWIDEEGRLRRFDQTMTIANPQVPGQSIEVSTRLEMYDFGVEVDVEAPPAEQVRDGAALLEAFRAGARSS